MAFFSNLDKEILKMERFSEGNKNLKDNAITITKLLQGKDRLTKLITTMKSKVIKQMEEADVKEYRLDAFGVMLVTDGSKLQVKDIPTDKE